MNGLTPEQFAAMGGKRTAPTSGGISPQDFISMGGQLAPGVKPDLPVNTLLGGKVGQQQLDKQGVANTQAYSQSPMSTTYEYEKGDPNSPSSVIGNNFLGKTLGRGLDFVTNFGAGAAKGLTELGDVALTAGNELLGISDDPRFRFGTDTRKARVEKLFRAKTGAGKVGRTAFDVASIVSPVGPEAAATKLVSPVTKAIQGSTAVANLSTKSSKAANILARALPQIPENIATGATFAARRDEKYTPANAILDTGITVTAPFVLKGLARMISPKFAASMDDEALAKATQKWQDMYDNPETKQGVVDLVEREVKDKADGLTNLKEVKNVLKATQEFSDVVGADEGTDLTNWGHYAIMNVGDALDQDIIKGNSLQTSHLTEAINKSQKKTVDAVSKLLQGKDRFYNVDYTVNDTIREALGYRGTAIDLPLDTKRSISKFLQSRQRSGIIDLLVTPVYDIAKQAGVEPYVARAMKDSVLKQVASKTARYSPEVADMIQRGLKDLRYAAMTRNVLNQLDGSVNTGLGGVVSKRIFTNLTAAMATGATWNPILYFGANAASGKLYDIANKIFSKTRLNNKALFKVARANKLAGMGGNEEFINKAVDLGERMSRQQTGEAILSKKAANQAKGAQKAEQIARRKLQSLEESANMDAIYNDPNNVPIPPKSVVTEANRALTSEIDTAKEVTREVKKLAKANGVTEHAMVMKLYTDIARDRVDLNEILDTAPEDIMPQIKRELETLDKQIELLSQYRDLPQKLEKKKLFRGGKKNVSVL